MSIADDLRRKANDIRRDVAWDTKWGTNFPECTRDPPLRRARELERAADILDGKSTTEKP